MDLGPQRFLEIAPDAIDVTIRIPGHVMSPTEGRELTYALGPRDARLCLELMDPVSRYIPLFHSSKTTLQALTKRPLDGGLKKRSS